MKLQNTKQLRNAYREYLNSYDSELRDVYDSWSRAKDNAMDYCKGLCYEMNGHGLKIISHNIFAFTAGFIFEQNGEKIFCFITKDSDRFMKI